MPLDLVVIPCRTDNYAYLLHDAATAQTALVDAPEAGPIADELSRRGWTLSDILITHHHHDHVEAVEDLRGTARVIGAAADVRRLPPLDLAVEEGSKLNVCGEEVRVIAVPGHTLGHIAFYVPASGYVFTADSLMALGCGRLFEGTAAQMWDSLQKLRALPPDTLVCSGHEYTAANAAFARTIDPENSALISRTEAVDAARSRGEPTVPSLLSDEIATNPFLRADDPELARSIGLGGADPVEVFAEIRARKDRF